MLRTRSLIPHYGTSIGHAGIINASKAAGSTIISDFVEFAGPSLVDVVYIPGSFNEAEQIVSRAYATLGMPYHHTQWNCENAAWYHRTGEAKSPTVQFLVGAAIVGALSYAVSPRPRAARRVRRRRRS